LGRSSSLPFPYHRPWRRIPDSPLSTPVRTSTSPQLHHVNFTQHHISSDPTRCSLWSLLGLQIDPRSALSRLLTPSFLKNVIFQNIAPALGTILTPRRHPRRPKIDPRRLQDDLQEILFSTSFLSSILIRLRSDFCLILAPL